MDYHNNNMNWLWILCSPRSFSQDVFMLHENWNKKKKTESRLWGIWPFSEHWTLDTDICDHSNAVFQKQGQKIKRMLSFLRAMKEDKIKSVYKIQSDNWETGQQVGPDDRSE